MDSLISCENNVFGAGDVHIKVEGIVYLCHRVVLSNAFKYFSIIFNGDFIEKNFECIHLPDIDSDAFKEILEFVYFKRSCIITDGNVFDLLVTSEYLLMCDKTVEKCCTEYILNNVTKIEMVLETFLFVRGANKELLVRCLRHYIVADLYRFSLDPKFLELPFCDLSYLLQYYRYPSPLVLPLRDENKLLDVLIRWTRHSFETRGQHFGNLIKIVVLEEVTDEYVHFMSIKYKKDRMWLSEHLPMLMTNDLEFSDVTRYDFAGIDFSGIFYGDPFFFGYKPAMHVFVDCYDSKSTMCCSINKYKAKWSITKTYLSPRNWLKFVAFNNSSVMYGLGIDENHRPMFRTFSSTDLCVKSKLTNPPIPLNLFQMCKMEINNNIYVYNHKPRSVYQYNCHADRWFSAPGMKFISRSPCMTAENNLVYLIKCGLFNNQDGYVQAYDYRAPSWFQLPKTHYSFSHNVQCCSMNGKVYASDDHVIEVFDQVAGKWEILTECNLINKKHEFRLTNIMGFENRLWLNAEAYMNGRSALMVATYDPNTRFWCTSMSLDQEFYAQTTYSGYCGINSAVVF